jgi:uncharacterized protein DUF1552
MHLPVPSISRRAFLKGAGVTLALPFLDAMLPSALRAAAESANPQRSRMIAISGTLGIHTPFLNPEQAGRGYTLTPYLEALEDFRNDFTVFSGLSHPEVDGGHASEASFFTAAAHPGTPAFRNSISLDQLAAEKLGGETRFASLVLNTSGGGTGLSWTRSGVAIPADGMPSKVFAKLFLTGTAKEVEAQVRKLRDGRSVVDAVNDQAKQMARTLGKRDSEKLDEYFTSVRELEQRLAKGEEWVKKPKPQVDAKPPQDSTDPADIIGRTRLMYDLMHLALQTDSTRLITLQVFGTGLVPPIAGVTEGHHNLSHHGKDPGKIEQLKAVELAEFEALAGLLEKLKATREEGVSLLDKTMVLFGSNLGNASSHDTKNMPVVLAGGGFKHGQHLAFDQQHNTPLCNLYVSMLQRLGIEADSFASSHGTLKGLDA